MASKAHMNRVKFEVRRTVLHLEEFTVQQVVKATELNPESIRTELQRMRKEGLLTTELSHREPGKRGGRIAFYKLTPDPEKRLALSRQVESFYPALPQQPSQQPTSRHYLIAKQLVDRVSAGRCQDAQERDKLLTDAQSHLDFAWHDEGEPVGIVGDHIRLERARLLFLDGKYPKAEELFRQIRGDLDAFKLRNEVTLVDEYLACIQVRRQIAQQQTFTPQALAHVALGVLREMDLSYLSNRPLAALLCDLMNNLASFTLSQLQEVNRQIVQDSIRQAVREAIPPTPLQPFPFRDHDLLTLPSDSLFGRSGLMTQPRVPFNWPESKQSKQGRTHDD